MAPAREAARIDRVAGGWRLRTAGGELEAAFVAVATELAEWTNSPVNSSFPGQSGSTGVWYLPLQSDGHPAVHGEEDHPGAPGLYFVGFTEPLSGNLRPLRIDAERIAQTISQNAL